MSGTVTGLEGEDGKTVLVGEDGNTILVGENSTDTGGGGNTGGGGTQTGTNLPGTLPTVTFPTITGSTVIQPLTGAQIAQRIAANFPNRWASDDAKQTGNLYSVFKTVGDQLSFILNEVIYVANATRLQTETSPELDIASTDFFGSGLPRPAGMADADFATLILENLFRPAATRPAFTSALLALTGYLPRLLEPWNVYDTGCWGEGGPSYWGVDTVFNPARWGNGSDRYQGYIETPPPAIPAVGANNPILCWGDGAYWNVPGYFFGIIQSTSLEDLYNTITDIKAEGTTVWVKIVTPSGGTDLQGSPPGPVGNLSVASVSATGMVLTWTTPTAGSPPFSYTAFYRTGGGQWQTGPTVQTDTVTLTGLQPNVTYEVQIVARNSVSQAASQIISGTTLKVAPSPATNLQTSGIGPTAVTLSWQAPDSGTPPFTMQARYRKTGDQDWIPFGVAGNYETITITGLQPLTEYDFDVTASN